MSNPWTKKNPLMSMWLSGANRVAGSARSQLTAELKKSAAQANKKAVSEAMNVWLKPSAGGGKSNRKK